MTTSYPILLVHGIDDTGIRFKKMKSVLEKRLFHPIQAMDIIPPDGSIPIEEMAKQVADKIDGLLSSSQSPKLDIVAFSMGTLAVRYFLQRMGGDSVVRRFISIAGPNHGTIMAYLRQNPACRQMRPGSRFLQDLNNDQDPWGKTQVYSFFTIFDLMIFPAVTSILPKAKNKLFFSPIHPLTVSDPWVMNGVCQALCAEN